MRRIAVAGASRQGRAAALRPGRAWDLEPLAGERQRRRYLGGDWLGENVWGSATVREGRVEMVEGGRLYSRDR